MKEKLEKVIEVYQREADNTVPDYNEGISIWTGDVMKKQTLLAVIKDLKEILDSEPQGEAPSVTDNEGKEKKCQKKDKICPEGYRPLLGYCLVCDFYY